MKKFGEIIDRLNADTVKLEDLGWLHKLAAEAIEVLSEQVEDKEKELIRLKWNEKTAPRWFSVSTLLPPDGEPVLAIIRGRSRPIMAWHSSNWLWHSFETEAPILQKVTHWMFLPRFEGGTSDGKA